MKTNLLLTVLAASVTFIQSSSHAEDFIMADLDGDGYAEMVPVHPAEMPLPGQPTAHGAVALCGGTDDDEITGAVALCGGADDDQITGALAICGGADDDQITGGADADFGPPVLQGLFSDTLGVQGPTNNISGGWGIDCFTGDAVPPSAPAIIAGAGSGGGPHVAPAMPAPSTQEDMDMALWALFVSPELLAICGGNGNDSILPPVLQGLVTDPLGVSSNPAGDGSFLPPVLQGIVSDTLGIVGGDGADFLRSLEDLIILRGLLGGPLSVNDDDAGDSSAASDSAVD